MIFLICDECEDEYNKKIRGIFWLVYRLLFLIEVLIFRKVEGVLVGNFLGIV